MVRPREIEVFKKSVTYTYTLICTYSDIYLLFRVTVDTWDMLGLTYIRMRMETYMSSDTHRADGGEIADDMVVRPVGSDVDALMPMWREESHVDAQLVAHIHEYLTVKEYVQYVIIELIVVIDLLQKWVENVCVFCRYLICSRNWIM